VFDDASRRKIVHGHGRRCFLILGVTLALLGLYGYAARFYKRLGGTAEGGSMYAVAWPWFMVIAPFTLGAGIVALAMAALLALLTRRPGTHRCRSSSRGVSYSSPAR
jgi:hypothetical protein